jgi:hypothetical protein
MKKNSKIIEPILEKDFNIPLSVEETIQEMLKNKEENPDLIIPYSFIEFYNKKEMIELVGAVFNYCKCLAGINAHLLMLKEEGKQREAKKFLETRSDQLPELGRTAAQKYGELLLMQRRVVINKLDDQSFFETVIYFLIKAIQPAFRKDQLIVLDDELNRLFRSTAFNITHRKLVEDERLKRFPQLKKPYSRRDPDSVIRNILLRSNYLKEKGKTIGGDEISRPGYVKMTPYKAITSRSPLISLLLPSPKDKIREFEENRKRLTTRYRNMANLKSH